MIVIAIKISGALILLWLALMMAAHPSTRFADWGEEFFGDYERFLSIIGCTTFLPVLTFWGIWGFIYLWSL